MCIDKPRVNPLFSPLLGWRNDLGRVVTSDVMVVNISAGRNRSIHNEQLIYRVSLTNLIILNYRVLIVSAFW